MQFMRTWGEHLGINMPALSAKLFCLVPDYCVCKNTRHETILITEVGSWFSSLNKLYHKQCYETSGVHDHAALFTATSSSHGLQALDHV